MVGPTADPSSLSSRTAKPRQIRWYRTPIDRELLRALSQRSDWKGALQTLGYLGLYSATALGSAYSMLRFAAPITAGVVFIHGMVTAFMIAGVHELGHGTVFRTKALNAFFVHVLAFLGWINHRMFAVSHSRHHAFTLHPPDDLEVTLPANLAVGHFFAQGFLNVGGLWSTLKETVRIARGRFSGLWELQLFPPEAPEKRKPPVSWARQLLLYHGLISVSGGVLGFTASPAWFMLPVVVTLAPFYGGWLCFLCTNTQHIGLQDNVPDFRLCCRTFRVNPLVRLLYWQMTYHTEHHMYPTVPCYNLGRLHTAVVGDLPPCPHGLFATWREIIPILRKQYGDPHYQHVAIVPVRPLPTGSGL